MNYAGLHVHTHYSLFDGIATPEEYLSRAVDLKMPALAITDHGTLSGHREFYLEDRQACRPVYKSFLERTYIAACGLGCGAAFPRVPVC